MIAKTLPSARCEPAGEIVLSGSVMVRIRISIIVLAGVVAAGCADEGATATAEYAAAIAAYQSVSSETLNDLEDPRFDDVLILLEQVPASNSREHGAADSLRRTILAARKKAAAERAFDSLPAEVTPRPKPGPLRAREERRAASARRRADKLRERDRSREERNAKRDEEQRRRKFERAASRAKRRRVGEQRRRDWKRKREQERESLSSSQRARCREAYDQCRTRCWSSGEAGSTVMATCMAGCDRMLTSCVGR